MSARSESGTSKTIIAIVLMGIMVWFLYNIRSILLPFIMSAILAYLLSPAANWLQSRLMVKRVYAVMIIYLLFIAAITVGVVLLVPLVTEEIKALKDNLPEYIDRGKSFILNLQSRIETRYPFIREQGIIEKGLVKAQQFFTKGISSLPGYIMGIFSLFSLLFLIPVVTLFFILGGKRAVNTIVNIIPARYIETSLSIFWEVDEVLGRYIRGLIIEALAVAVLATTGFLIIGIHYAFLIGIIVAVTNVVPYLGPIIGGIVALLIGVIKYQSLSIVVKVLIVIAAVQFLENNFVQPIVQSKGTELNPVVIIFAILAGAEIYGILGMLLAVPVAAMIKVTVDVLLRKHHTYA